jgi:hypothetical protein
VIRDNIHGDLGGEKMEKKWRKKRKKMKIVLNFFSIGISV